MPYNVFPLYNSAGLAWDIKKRILTSTAIEESGNGSEFTTARWSKVHYEFDLTWNYLSPTDRDTLEDFIVQQLGPATPFYLTVTEDNTFTAKQCTGTANGTNKIFQVPLRAQSFINATTSLTDNGAAAGAYTIDNTGLITFTTAPLAGHVIRWTGTYYYLVRFKEDSQELNQILSQMFEVPGGITFRTRR